MVGPCLNDSRDFTPELSHLAVILLDHLCSARKIERARRLFEILIRLMKHEYLERFKPGVMKKLKS